MWWTSFVVLSWPALSVSHVSMTSSGMKRGEQSGSRPPQRASAYEISKPTGFHVDFGFQSGFLPTGSSCMFLDILVIVPSLAKNF